MSKIAKKPVVVPQSVEIKIAGQTISVKGKKGLSNMDIHPDVSFKKEEEQITFAPRKQEAMPLAGTMRALVNNLIIGVTEGFERKLELVGVGYRAQVKGKVLNLQLGFSHPINFPIPEGITIETPSQTEVVVSGIDKRDVSQVAAEIRSFRPPEPYKGKGVRYSGEQIIRKETKKK